MTKPTVRQAGLYVGPPDEPIFDERGYWVKIDDESGGEYVVLRSNECSAAAGEVKIDPADWPALRSAIDTMIGECKNYD